VLEPQPYPDEAAMLATIRGLFSDGNPVTDVGNAETDNVTGR